MNRRGEKALRIHVIAASSARRAKLAEIATWDDRLLAEQLQELSVHGLDFNIEVTGFEMGEIDLRIASLKEPPERDDDPADEVPEVPAGPAVSRWTSPVRV